MKKMQTEPDELNAMIKGKFWPSIEILIIVYKSTDAEND